MFGCILPGLLAASFLAAQRSPAPSLRMLYDAKGTTQVRGIGGAESYASVTLSEITFEIGGIHAIPRSHDVLMNRGIRSYIGNFGLDIFQQGRAFKFDFTAMRLELEAAP